LLNSSRGFGDRMHYPLPFDEEIHQTHSDHDEHNNWRQNQSYKGDVRQIGIASAVATGGARITDTGIEDDADLWVPFPVVEPECRPLYHQPNEGTIRTGYETRYASIGCRVLAVWHSKAWLMGIVRHINEKKDINKEETN